MFGWDYPPGAEHDPNAPWNQPELDDWEEKDDTDQDDEESEID